MTKPIIDIHSHSTLKPYGNSFKTDSNPYNMGDSACIWTQDKDTNYDADIENVFGISRYRQADFKSSVEGGVRIVFTSLYPSEVGFFEIRKKALSANEFERRIAQFASLFSKARIDHVMNSHFNYFIDLNKEYDFLKKLNGTQINGKTYRIANNIGDIQNGPGTDLWIIPTIEGAHVFCEGRDVNDDKSWTKLTSNITDVKDWDHPPFIITLAHHFYNSLCTHAQSLTGQAGSLLDQTYGMSDGDHPETNIEPLTQRGVTVIQQLLSRENGRRIHIDIKHMSVKARDAYYRLVENQYQNDPVPIICSHGGINTYYKHDINLRLDEDIYRIYKTGGLFGIELDQRILGSDHGLFQKPLKWFKWALSKKKKRSIEFNYFFRTVIDVAEYAHEKQFPNPWQCICLGSDFDGIINPLNTFRRADSLQSLYDQLIEGLEDYFADEPKIPANYLGMNAETIAKAIMYDNAYNFMVKYYVQ